jgi:hypothetical protein
MRNYDKNGTFPLHVRGWNGLSGPVWPREPGGREHTSDFVEIDPMGDNQMPLTRAPEW